MPRIFPVPIPRRAIRKCSSSIASYAGQLSFFHFVFALSVFAVSFPTPTFESTAKLFAWFSLLSVWVNIWRSLWKSLRTGGIQVVVSTFILATFSMSCLYIILLVHLTTARLWLLYFVATAAYMAYCNTQHESRKQVTSGLLSMLSLLILYDSSLSHLVRRYVTDVALYVLDTASFLTSSLANMVLQAGQSLYRTITRYLPFLHSSCLFVLSEASDCLSVCWAILLEYFSEFMV